VPARCLAQTRDASKGILTLCAKKQRGNGEKMETALLYQQMARPLVDWFHDNARVLRWRLEPIPYYVWISEIMLQQTRVEAVKGYFDRFVEELPDIAALAACPEEKLLKLWEGLGYYNRVRNLKKAAILVTERYDGKLPDSYEELQKLPGIGSYTAGAIVSIAYGKPAPAVDGNVLRVTKRIAESYDDITKPAVKSQMEQMMFSVTKWAQGEGIYPGDFNQSLMELGAVICIPVGKPLCEKCPVQKLCRIKGRDELWREIPVKPVKKGRRVEERTVFLLEQKLDGETDYGLRKRPDKGLLAGMWELPGTPGKLSKQEAADFLKDELKVRVLELITLPDTKHIFTHVEWQMKGYLARIAGCSEECTKIHMASEEEIEKKYTIPSAFMELWRQRKKE